MRLILIDDHTWIHQTVTDLIELADDIDLLGQGTDGEQALDLYKQHQPDIVLMDIVMPHQNGIQATRMILENDPNAKVLAMSSFQDERSVFDMLQAGAVGYLVKANLAQELITTIRTVNKGGTVLSAPIASVLTNRPSTTMQHDAPNPFNLTEREVEVLQSLAEGNTNAEVASVLNISPATVRYHITNITEKMNVATRTEAIVLGVRYHIL